MCESTTLSLFRSYRSRRVLTTLLICSLVSGCRHPDSNESADEAQITEQTPRDLFDGETLDGWKIVDFGGQDDVRVTEGAITVRAGYPLAGIVWAGDKLPRNQYRLELEAKKIDGTDFFCCLTFPVNDQSCSLVLGGWGGTVTGISCIDGRDASDNATRTLHKYEPGRWYAIQVEVSVDRIICQVDGKAIVDVRLEGIELSLRPEVVLTAPLGICAYETSAAWRNIRLTGKGNRD